MILLLGSTGYIGSGFEQALRARDEKFLALSRREIDYTNFSTLLNCLRKTKATFVINAAGFTGKPNVDACEIARAETILGNTVFPVTVANACDAANIPWGHVSSGCIYDGAKICENGTTHIVRNMLEQNRPALRGFTENDTPNFSFRAPPCSFYSGTKALAEEALPSEKGFIWRLRIPFDEFDNARNYLSKLQRYEKVYDNINSLSHRADFAHACLDLWNRRAPFGIYNVTNPGFVSARDVVALIEKILKPKRAFRFWNGDDEFYTTGKHAPRSNCILDVSKLLATGVEMRPVHDALENALRNWKS